jgi:hypothetical protein
MPLSWLVAVAATPLSVDGALEPAVWTWETSPLTVVWTWETAELTLLVRDPTWLVTVPTVLLRVAAGFRELKAEVKVPVTVEIELVTPLRLAVTPEVTLGKVPVRELKAAVNEVRTPETGAVLTVSWGAEGISKIWILSQFNNF